MRLLLIMGARCIIRDSRCTLHLVFTMQKFGFWLIHSASQKVVCFLKNILCIALKLYDPLQSSCICSSLLKGINYTNGLVSSWYCPSLYYLALTRTSAEGYKSLYCCTQVGLGRIYHCITAGCSR